MDLLRTGARHGRLAALVALAWACAMPTRAVLATESTADAPGVAASAPPANAPATTVNPAPGRARIGLVLSGGGARGAAHVGVIRALEDMHVPIDAVVG